MLSNIGAKLSDLKVHISNKIHVTLLLSINLWAIGRNVSLSLSNCESENHGGFSLTQKDFGARAMTPSN